MKEEKQTCKNCGFYVPISNQGFCSISRVRVFEEQDCNSFEDKPIVIDFNKYALIIILGLLYIFLLLLLGR